MTRHYDVVVLGRTIGALSAAAVLARRDFRVLLLGQGQRAATYHFDGTALARRTFTLLSGSSPAFRRILHELAQSPRFRRRTRPIDPMFVVLTPERRVEVPPDMELYAREIDREFPEVRQLVDELYATFAEVNAAADAAFERDVVWPPGTLWERLETGRAAALLPFSTHDGPTDLLAKFPVGHPYRELCQLPASFATHLATPLDKLPPFAFARLHGAWTRGIEMLKGGEDELEQLLIERIEAHGGECRLDERASSIIVKRGAAVGVLEDGSEEPVGASHIVSALGGEALADMAGGAGITRLARREWPRLTAASARFVVSLSVNTEGLPEPLGVESFIVPTLGSRPDPRRPRVHLQRLDPTPHTDPPEAAVGRTLLVAETLLPTRGPLTLPEGRDAVLATLREHLPFIERHLRVVDSPHDGLPVHHYVDGVRREVDRLHLTDAAPSAEPMERLWTVDPPGYLELSGEPVRGPIPGTFLVGPTVLPALGQEGELLSALGVARLITQRDKKRQKLRRQMWTKIETG